jgi:ankyrin repeat protein
MIETKTMSIREATWNLQIEDTVITSLANFFKDHGLGTYSDAISCVMPLLRSQLRSYHDSLLSMLIRAATQYRLNAEWLRAERVLRWVCESYEKDTQENKNMALQELGELYRRSFESGARNFGTNGIKWMVSKFEGNEISKRYDDIAKKINKDNDIYQWPASRFSEAINKRNRVDALSHLCFTKPGDFNSDKLGKCLPLAARNGWSEVVTTLLEMRVNPNMQDDDGRTAASYFAELGQERPLQQLIDNGADLDMADHTELTPLVYAVKNEKKNIVMQLLNNTQIDCNKQMTNGRSALWFAVEQNNIKAIEELLGNGGGIDQEDDYRVSPLFLAARKGHKEAMELLIKRGAAVDRADSSQATPLIWAMWRGHAEIVKLLVKALEKEVQTQSIQDQITEAKRLLGYSGQIDRIRNRSDGVCSTWDIRPESTRKQIDQQHIDFDFPYSKAPRIMLGISSIKMKWRPGYRVQWEASNVTGRQLELTRTGFNGSSPNSSNGSNGSNGSNDSKLTVKSSSVVWIEFDSDEEDFQGMVGLK